MSTATLAFTPLFDEAGLATLRQQAAHVGRTLVRTLGLVASSLAFAAVLWLILAGPGVLTDQASTTTAHGTAHGRMVAHR